MTYWDWKHAALILLCLVVIGLGGCEALRGLRDDDATNFWNNTTKQVGGGVQ